jgi:hypothetical protein
MNISEEKLEQMMSEIEDLQKQVDDILYNPNPFYRFFHMKKARKLHEKYKMKMIELFYPIYKDLKRQIRPK